MPQDSLTITDNRTGQKLHASRRKRNHPRHGSAQDQDRTRRLRRDDLRSGLHQYGVLPERHHLHRRRQRYPALSRISRRGLGRELHVSWKSPTCCCSANCPPRELKQWVERLPSHHAPRDHQEIHGRLPLQRASHGHVHQHRGGAVDRVSGGEATCSTPNPPAADQAADRQDAHDRGHVVSPQPGDFPTSIPTTISPTRKLHEHAVEDGRAEVCRQPGDGARARHPVCPARRP
jgi:hypothetical protein